MVTRTQQPEKNRAALGDLCFFSKKKIFVSKRNIIFEFFFFFFCYLVVQLTLHLPHISSIPKKHGAPRKIPQINWPITITKSKSLLSRRFSDLSVRENSQNKMESSLWGEKYINIRISPFVAHKSANRANTIPRVKMNFAAISNDAPNVSQRNNFWCLFGLKHASCPPFSHPSAF